MILTLAYSNGTALFPPILRRLLPSRLTDAIRRCGLSRIEELRLHCHRFCTVTCDQKSHSTQIILTEEELNRLLRDLCGGSLYAYEGTMRQGYLTVENGIRVGICGKAALDRGEIVGVGEITGLILRIPHVVICNTDEIMERLVSPNGEMKSLLIYAPPGVGKTTLLRSLARQLASHVFGLRTVIVDTREELGFSLEDPALSLDILSAYPRALGLEIALRSLGAQVVLCDEIGNEQDADAILSATGSGVAILATAHAAGPEELLSRPALRRLHLAGVFGLYAGLRRKENGEFSYEFHSHKELSEILLEGATAWKA